MKLLRLALVGSLPVLVFLTTANSTVAAIADQPSECNDAWTTTSSTNAPTGREFHSALWTGGEMIVWGGTGGDHTFTGGRYCADSDPPPITLDARVRRQDGKRIVALTWSPADGGSISVLRYGVVVDATEDDGTAQDKLGTHTGTFFYQVCETDSGDCSNQVKVVVQ